MHIKLESCTLQLREEIMETFIIPGKVAGLPIGRVNMGNVVVYTGNYTEDDLTMTPVLLNLWISNLEMDDIDGAQVIYVHIPSWLLKMSRAMLDDLMGTWGILPRKVILISDSQEREQKESLAKNCGITLQYIPQGDPAHMLADFIKEKLV